MPDPDFISFLKTLKPEDWDKKATDKWTVKDVVAHMVGWEKGGAEAIRTAWETKQAPWWMSTNNYDEFNTQSVAHYKNYTPEQLITEWQTWQHKIQGEIDRIGEINLKSRPDLFAWLFEDTEDDIEDETESHYQHHYNQIKKAISGVDS